MIGEAGWFLLPDTCFCRALCSFLAFRTHLGCWGRVANDAPAPDWRSRTARRVGPCSWPNRDSPPCDGRRGSSPHGTDARPWPGYWVWRLRSSSQSPSGVPGSALRLPRRMATCQVTGASSKDTLRFGYAAGLVFCSGNTLNPPY